MKFQQHVPDKELRELIRDELSGNQKDLVRLHLSYCLICQKEYDEILLDEANLELCGVTNKSLTKSEEHIEDTVFAEFWKGQLNDPHRLEEISAHCLVCELCRNKRYEVWWHHRKDVAMRRFATVIFGVLVAVATRARNYRHVAGMVGVGFIAALVFYLLAGSWVETSLSVRVSSEAIPSIGLDSVHPSPITDYPAVISGPKIEPEDTGESAVVQATPHRSPDTTLPAGKTAMKRAERLWEELARVQRISLEEPTDVETFRGDDTAHREQQYFLPVVISRTENTHIHIQLPQDSKQGKYLVTLVEPEEIDKQIAADESVTLDGKELSVSLGLTSLLSGEYVLLVERKTNEADDREFLGYFPVFIIAPSARK